jgi:subtilase family serine protease
MMKSALTFIVLFFMMTAAFAAGRQQLNGSSIPQEALQHPLGPLAPHMPLHLAVELPIRHKEQRDQLLKDLNDPKSPQFRHYLKPQEFTERFGPAQADYDAVTVFFRDQGFKVTVSPGRTLLDIDGTVKMAEAVFHVDLILYKHPTQDREFYAPDRAPSVDLGIPLSGVAGLDNFGEFQPLSGVQPHYKARLKMER